MFLFLQKNDYYKIGQLLAIGVMQGATGLHLLGPSTFDYIFRGISASDLIPDIEELPDTPIRKIALKVFEVCFQSLKLYII